MNEPTVRRSAEPAKRIERDGRVDLLRGFALLTIFVDHIPENALASLTLHNLGFSDAAELFVLLAGFSTATAYGRLFDRDGTRAGVVKVAKRCLSIYGVHVFLFLATLLIVALWSRWSGLHPRFVGPLLKDGVFGILRGLTLSALPTYLDILPLYVVLLALFPLIWLGMRASLKATLAASVLLYALANVFRLNLPNSVDPADPQVWYFNPFTWQIIFVLGIAGAIRMRTQVAPISRFVAALCVAYLVFAFVAVDAWGLWPAPLGRDFAGKSFPFAIFGNEPKSFVTPWRLLHAVAIAVFVLGSPRLAAFSKSRAVWPLVCCGRHSLLVFAAGCLLALFGRLFFNSAGVNLTTELIVNVIGLTSLLALGIGLERARLAAAHRALRQADQRRRAAQPIVKSTDLRWDETYRPRTDLGGDILALLNEVSRSLQSLTDAPDDSRKLTDEARFRSGIEPRQIVTPS